MRHFGRILSTRWASPLDIHISNSLCMWQSSSVIYNSEETMTWNSSISVTKPTALWCQCFWQATIAILLKLEEILPRPNEGLLKRMVRLSDVRLLSSIDDSTPTLQLKASAEYRVALQILPSPQWKQSNVRHWVKWVKMNSHGWRARIMQVSFHFCECTIWFVDGKSRKE